MAINTVNFTITAGQVSKITDYLGYQTDIEDVEGNSTPNPETRKIFLYKNIKDYLKNCYKAECAKDGETARLAALEQAETDLKNLDIAE